MRARYLQEFADLIEIARRNGTQIVAVKLPVPALSISQGRRAWVARSRIMPSARGERQILPRQTISIFIMVIRIWAR